MVQKSWISPSSGISLISVCSLIFVKQIFETAHMTVYVYILFILVGADKSTKRTYVRHQSRRREFQEEKVLSLKYINVIMKPVNTYNYFCKWKYDL
jgi:hypothetical protein